MQLNTVKTSLIKHKSSLLLCLAMLWLFSSAAMAEQVQVTGSATIVNGNVERAREGAINQALNYASLKAGVNFSSMQQTQQGQLTQDSFAIQRMGVANDIQLVSEIISDDVLTVTLQLEVIEQEVNAQCSSHSLRAAIFLPKAYIKERRDLAYGQLSDFERDFSEKFGEVINEYSQYSFARVFANERIDNTIRLTSYRGNSLPTWTSKVTDSHYMLQAEIEDMSTEQEQNYLFGLINHYPERQMRYKLTLFHGISGEQLWHKSFMTSAPWQFKRNQAVATNSRTFWASAYGTKLTELFEQSLTELDQELNCRPLLGQIIARQGERIIINMGRNSGVKMGDKFQIVLQRNIPDRLNMMRAVATKSRATVQIDQVTADTATANITGIEMADNIQISDIAIKI